MSAAHTIAAHLERGRKIVHDASGVTAWRYGELYFVRGRDKTLDSFEAAAEAARYVVREAGIR